MTSQQQIDQAEHGGYGSLPASAPLANPYVPMQDSCSPVYSATNGWLHGTLFPGLFLPLKNNEEVSAKENTMLHDLQATQFAIQELGLYLDTHADDQEAVTLYCQYVEHAEMLQQKLENRGCALTQMQSVQNGKYTWTADPWPWDLKTEG